MSGVPSKQAQVINLAEATKRYDVKTYDDRGKPYPWMAASEGPLDGALVKGVPSNEYWRGEYVATLHGLLVWVDKREHDGAD